VIVLIRSGRRHPVAAAGLVLVGAVLAPAALAPAPAHAASGGVEVSADGAAWVDSGAIDVFDAASLIVPGDELKRAVWIRNASDVTATPRLDGQWHPTDSSRAADVALASALEADIGGDAPRWEGDVLAPGAIVRVPVEAVLPASAGNDVRTGMATLTVTATLTEATDGAIAPTGEDDLAVTGAPVDPRLAGLGALALALGAALVARRRSVTPRPQTDVVAEDIADQQPPAPSLGAARTLAV